MAGLSRLEISFFYFYFLLHIPITILIDSAVVIPPKFRIAGWLLERHIAQNNDFLLCDRPMWLQVFVALELTVQLPLFFQFAKQLRRNSVPRRSLKLYGLLASTTTLVCIGAILEGHYPGTAIPMTSLDKGKLVCVYLPTFLLPFRLVLL
ncbi:ZYBA0S09-00276g1_1 [Zygosaccharomyces bailii CLIB 213]|uniref:ZYBA0S09-00276g1_1 n=1 Tax=Zygosaccharomyces bailii (strain CLIB 213 / ATCC 58445 / CBS 680 / BCRC 21525 / NBRC 1098 / NCYC 1416 / NRRL Y-2227) TaxID=1333698 RepID=A0A8J2X9K7_ZYGB2|nr:ZYBA0S09-00276g1_1 [Zygosaccharomyces bailii CLIB 213]